MDHIYVDEKLDSLDILVKEGESVRLRLAYFHDFPEASINVNVEKDGAFDGAFADFSSKSGTFSIKINLLGEGANANWHYAGVCQNSDYKIVKSSIVHHRPLTKGDINQYGIATGKGHLSFLGESTIMKGAVGSETHQKEKIIVFDMGCVGKCSPGLNIDENDVIASHSAVVGKLSDEHLFYLLSRGIPLDEAKRLLVLGYLRPSLAFFDGEVGERISKSIDGGFGND